MASTYLLPLLLILLAVPACSQTEGEADVRQTVGGADVQQTYNRYRAEVLEGDGPGALALVSASTVAHFDHAVDLAVTGDSAIIAELPTVDRSLVFTLRHRLRPDELRSLTGPEAFELIITRGWLDLDGMRRQRVGEVNIEGDLAIVAVLEVGVESSEVWVRMIREEGDWLVDLTSLYEIGSLRLDRYAKDEGVAVNDIISASLEAASGRPVEDSIWHPIGR